MNQPSNFTGHMERLVAAHFPEVSRFEVDRFAWGVQPVVYRDERRRERKEYPPVARWRVGGRRYAYVMRPDYSQESGRLWQLLAWSVEGKDADEINLLLGNDMRSAKKADAR